MMQRYNSHQYTAWPLVACGVWALAHGHTSLSGSMIVLVIVALMGAVFAAVHHAEVIALRVGEPFGTLVLALAITVIEASLIVSLMLSGGQAAVALARDALYATVMIICNGVVGLCLLLGAMRHHVLGFKVDGTTPALSVLVTLATLTLVLPSFTTSTLGPTLSSSQLLFAGAVSFVLYGVFVFVQTVRHRDYFLPVEPQVPTKTGGDPSDTADDRPSVLASLASFGLLVVALVAVVGLAKTLAPTIESVVRQAGVPQAVVGIAVALMVLLPETAAALRAALLNRMQISFNLALGSALATIGLTIPAVAVTALVLDLPLVLGLPPKDMVLLALTFLITAMTLSRSRATVLQGAVHVVLFAVFLFFAVVP